MLWFVLCGLSNAFSTLNSLLSWIRNLLLIYYYHYFKTESLIWIMGNGHMFFESKQNVPLCVVRIKRRCRHMTTPSLWENS